MNMEEEARKRYDMDIFKKAYEHPKAQEWAADIDARLQLALMLHEARKEKNMTMAELAKKAQTTPAVISRIEHREVSVGIDLVFRLFKAVGKKEITFRCS